jgi:hypothetical protein
MLFAMVNITRIPLITWVSEHSFATQKWFAIIAITGWVRRVIFIGTPSFFFEVNYYRKIL